MPKEHGAGYVDVFDNDDLTDVQPVKREEAPAKKKAKKSEKDEEVPEINFEEELAKLKSMFEQGWFSNQIYERFSC